MLSESSDHFGGVMRSLTAQKFYISPSWLPNDTKGYLAIAA
jgi:hypothetical protein